MLDCVWRLSRCLPELSDVGDVRKDHRLEGQLDLLRGHLIILVRLTDLERQFYLQLIVLHVEV